MMLFFYFLRNRKTAQSVPKLIVQVRDFVENGVS